MVTRYKHKDSKGVFAHPEQHPRGEYVLYTDHADEIARYKAMLRKHTYKNKWCIECDTKDRNGHAPDCALAKLLEE